MKRIDVYPLPDLAPETPFDGVSVAVDVLRATTTIATALASGAEKVLPFETVEETLAAKRAFLARRPDERDLVKLGGERNAIPIDGFDFGNSPSQYAPETIAGKTLLFTTTNGTRTILSCRGTVLLGAFVNAEAVVKRILREDKDVVSIVCAGTDGQYTEEDLLLAGLVVDRLTLRSSGAALNVQAEVSRDQWRRQRSTPLVELLKSSRGGQNLRKAKLLADVADAAKLDSLDVVPEFRIGKIQLDSAFHK